MNQLTLCHKNSNQRDRILTELNVRPLTGWQIMHELDTMNYKARISELRGKGHDIKKRWIKRDTGARIAEYYL